MGFDAGLCIIWASVICTILPFPKFSFQVPIAIPIIVVLFAVLLVITPLVSDPQLAYVYGIVLLVASPIVYYPMVHRKYRIPGMDTFTTFAQQVFNVSPANWEDNLAKAHHDD